MANPCVNSMQGQCRREKNGAVKMHEVAMRHAYAIEGALPWGRAVTVSSWLSTRRIAGAAASSSTAGV
jgi:hypothetical protein